MGGTTATALPPTTPTPPGQESVDTDTLPLATDAADTDTSDIISASDPLTLMPTRILWSWIWSSWIRIRSCPPCWRCLLLPQIRPRTSWILRPRIRICSLGLSHSEDVPFLKRGHLVQWMYTFNQWFSSKKDSFHTLITSLQQEFTEKKFKSKFKLQCNSNLVCKTIESLIKNKIQT